jgi:signal-transduction protein with cAMP-binding, CBS, and nucleotidyltransferase domain
MAWTIESAIVRKVATIDEHRSCLEAAQVMTKEFVGALVITSTSGITGFFTERDLMTRLVAKGRDPEKVSLQEMMTGDLLKVGPRRRANDCLDLMKQHRCRHLLVFDGDEFIGIISLRDIVALMMEEQKDLIGQLEQYISS